MAPFQELTAANDEPTKETITQNVDPPPLEWDWDIEHADRKRERQADAALHGATPFEVDRRVLKDVVLEHMKTPVARIVFLSAGTFHKAYLITLTSSHQVVARVARRFMPRLKTESEIATLSYLREKTSVPVPEVHCYDSNPYNRLGGEYILMSKVPPSPSPLSPAIVSYPSKAPGVPLSQVYHSMSYAQLVKLLDNLAALMIPLFGHRFPQIGSLYHGPDPTVPVPAMPLLSSNAPTPTLTRTHSLAMSALTSRSPSLDTPRAAPEAYTAFPFTPTLTPRAPVFSTSTYASAPAPAQHSQFHIGPIISWPFFGTHRGDLPSTDVPRGPFPSTPAYLAACVTREVLAVQRENAGSAAGHKLHLDPAEIQSSRHHAVRGVPGDESDESDEWDLEESEDEWEGPGDVMYRDYRRGQRATFLVAHMQAREGEVRRELGRWMGVVERLRDEWRRGGERTGVGWGTRHGAGSEEEEEEFALDAHDLSLENMFVDPENPAAITCVIDWESTTTRPLWASAHLPAFLQSSPFTAKLFREAVARLAVPSPPSTSNPTANLGADVPRLAREWLYHERGGMRLRMAHRVVEWDGWEEGLVDSILGPEEVQEEWFQDHEAHHDEDEHEHDEDEDEHVECGCDVKVDGNVDGNGNGHGNGNGVRKGKGHGDGHGDAGVIGESLSRRRDGDALGKTAKAKAKAKGGTTTGKPTGKLFAKDLEREREQMLDTTGDICGGRGGELGRRLEAWLTVSENASPEDELTEPWPDHAGENGYEAEAKAGAEKGRVDDSANAKE
ncbi:hypothetical protein DFH07DRAFT_987346 [Mycena maculata]|uniref:Aminoglycoside phosphotransferase domain-containing protein n=1 Tax=Mycena maculata TaxID=230809 RepID=A0AAD7MWJ9_9AGAR|nr:hypothetical protein DFH07DRAFT_987346 [Mycena maculata]